MDCKVRIVLWFDGERTRVKTMTSSPPIRFLDVGQLLPTERLLRYMIQSASPGILSADTYRISIGLQPEAYFQLTTQAYQRLYDMDAPARLSNLFSLQKGSLFSYIPHPTVPHKNAKFFSKTKINMASESVLLFGEILTCGRNYQAQDNQEQFVFSYVHSYNEIFLQKTLIFKDNLQLDPVKFPLSGMGFLEGYTHQGTLLFIDDKTPICQEDIAAFRAVFDEQEDLEYGLSQLSCGGLMLRVLGRYAEQLYACFKQIEHYVLTRHCTIGGKPLVF